jgi:molybdopterin synthase sulfur carrier subunit
MGVKVRVPTLLRGHVGGQAVVEADGRTVRALLDDLESRYPGFAGSILTEDGSLRRFINLYVNDEDVRYIGALQAQIDDGDTVSILPAVAGGALAPLRCG